LGGLADAKITGRGKEEKNGRERITTKTHSLGREDSQGGWRHEEFGRAEEAEPRAENDGRGKSFFVSCRVEEQ